MNKKISFRRFALLRYEDETGISVIGKIAEGVQFSSGKCVLAWIREIPSVTVYDTVDQVISILYQAGGAHTLAAAAFRRALALRPRHLPAQAALAELEPTATGSRGAEVIRKLFRRDEGGHA